MKRRLLSLFFIHFNQNNVANKMDRIMNSYFFKGGKIVSSPHCTRQVSSKKDDRHGVGCAPPGAARTSLTEGGDRNGSRVCTWTGEVSLQPSTEGRPVTIPEGGGEGRALDNLDLPSAFVASVRASCNGLERRQNARCKRGGVRARGSRCISNA